jgi:hypothetical protein
MNPKKLHAALEDTKKTRPKLVVIAVMMAVVIVTVLLLLPLSTSSSLAFADSANNELQEQQTSNTKSKNHTESIVSTVSKSYSQDIELTISPADINRLSELFPQAIDAQDGEYGGQIALDTNNPYTIEELYQSQAAQVDRSLVIAGLPDNDASRLEVTKSFSVRSAASINATEQKDLELASVTYKITDYTDLGLPIEYQADLTYRGAEEFLVLSGYRVTAHYLGDISTQIIHELEIPLASMPVFAQIQAEEVPLNLALLIAAASVIVILAGLLFWFLALRKNLRFVRYQEQESLVLFRRHVKVRDGICLVEIPNKLEIIDDASYKFILKPALANQEGYLAVSWRGNLISEQALSEQISLNLSEILIKDSDFVLADELVALAEVA